MKLNNVSKIRPLVNPEKVGILFLILGILSPTPLSGVGSLIAADFLFDINVKYPTFYRMWINVVFIAGSIVNVGWLIILRPYI